METDFSIWSLAMQADVVVKLVMVSLLLASVWSWAIIFEKARVFRGLSSKARAFEDAFWSGGSLKELYARVGDAPDHPLAAVFSVAMREWTLAGERGLSMRDERGRGNLEARIDRVMAVAVQRAIEDLERRLGFLASVGSTAPFVGLPRHRLGHHEQFPVDRRDQRHLARRGRAGHRRGPAGHRPRPRRGIPAVVAYNRFSNDLNRYAGRLETFAGEFSALLSRQLAEQG